MGDITVERWRLEGHLYIWHYPKQKKGGEGWHLSADALACQSVANLVDRIFDSRWKEQKRIPVTTPGKLRENQESVSALLLRYPKQEVEENFWHAEHKEGNVLTLTLGYAKLRAFQEGILGLPQWRDDYALGPESVKGQKPADYETQALWLWTKVT